MKSLKTFCLSLLLFIGYASATEKIEPILIEPIEIQPIEVQSECPEGSNYAGERIPEWVVGEEAAEFYCNSEEEKSESVE